MRGWIVWVGAAAFTALGFGLVPAAEAQRDKGYYVSGGRDWRGSVSHRTWRVARPTYNARWTHAPRGAWVVRDRYWDPRWGWRTDPRTRTVFTVTPAREVWFLDPTSGWAFTIDRWGRVYTADPRARWVYSLGHVSYWRGDLLYFFDYWNPVGGYYVLDRYDYYYDVYWSRGRRYSYWDYDYAYRYLWTTYDDWFYSPRFSVSINFHFYEPRYVRWEGYRPDYYWTGRQYTAAPDPRTQFTGLPMPAVATSEQTAPLYTGPAPGVSGFGLGDPSVPLKDSAPAGAAEGSTLGADQSMPTVGFGSDPQTLPSLPLGDPAVPPVPAEAPQVPPSDPGFKPSEDWAPPAEAGTSVEPQSMGTVDSAWVPDGGSSAWSSPTAPADDDRGASWQSNPAPEPLPTDEGFKPRDRWGDAADDAGGAFEAPVWDSPRDETPSYEAPQWNRPQDPEPSYEAPVWNDVPRSEPAYEAPQWQKPRDEPPSYEAPQWSTPREETPSYEAPVWNDAPRSEPAHEAPQWQTPRDEPPSYEAPQWSTPRDETPSYEPPRGRDDRHEAPSWNADDYDPRGFDVARVDRRDGRDERERDQYEDDRAQRHDSYESDEERDHDPPDDWPR